jgi:hypothetical protein
VKKFLFFANSEKKSLEKPLFFLPELEGTEFEKAYDLWFNFVLF